MSSNEKPAVPDEIADELVAHSFLAELPGDPLRFLAGCAHRERFAEGEFLLREGEAADVFHLIRSGRIALEVHLPGRGTTQMEGLSAGDVLGLSWLHPPYRWRLDARAVEPVETIAFDAACLRAKMEADPAFGYALAMRLLAQVARRLDHVRLQRLDAYRAGAEAER